jgi:hypothetical protein
MTIQVQNSAFLNERALRYKSAMSTFPTARCLELLPFLCMCAKPDISKWDVIDFGSGDGFLADFFDGLAKSVLRVDSSPDMLPSNEKYNSFVCDMSQASRFIDSKADLITSIASFHHNHIPQFPKLTDSYTHQNTRHWTPEVHLDIEDSLELQSRILHDWCSMLKPGGMIVLIDVPGYPDTDLDRNSIENELHCTNTRFHSINMRAYYNSFIDKVSNWELDVDLEIYDTFFQESSEKFWSTNEYIKNTRRLFGYKRTMKDLLESYSIPTSVLKKSGPMIPTDFIDDIVSKFNFQGHFGYYPRETNVRRIFKAIGMEEIQTGIIPTPWKFRNKNEAAWFMHELFGIGNQWQIKSIPERELSNLIDWMAKYLGFYQDCYGQTMLFWQLGYFIARKPTS